ncbi:MAG: hypothetical protein AB1635_15630 [Acidobacteriota bacterium]
MASAPRLPAVRVLAPDALHLTATDFAALGTPRAPSGTRAAVIERCRHMVATAGGRPVGIAAFEVEQDIVRVHELTAVDCAPDTIDALVTAVELACLAAGASRIFISAVASCPAELLEVHGYRASAGGRWLEKVVP